jgi:hypothetical protein
MVRLCSLLLLGMTAVFAQAEKPKEAAVPPNAKLHAAGPGDTHKPSDKPGRVEYLDFRNGLLEAKFGSPVTAFQGMNVVEDLGDLKFYKKDNEIRRLGLVAIDSVIYEFYDGKLMGVSLTVTGQRSSDALLRMVETLYGPGRQTKPTVLEMFWGGHVATAQYTPLPNGDSRLRVVNNKIEQDFIGQEAGKLAGKP